MAYNSKYTGAQVEALLDRAGAAPQTYDIGWLMDLITASEGSQATLTAEQFNEVKAAADAGKVLTGSGTVWSASAGSYSYPDSGDTQDYINLLSAPIDAPWDGDYYEFFPRIMELEVSRTTTASGSVTCVAEICDRYSIVDKRVLSRYAEKADISAFLKLKYQFTDISESSTPSLTVAAGNWYYLSKGLTSPTSLSITIGDQETGDDDTAPIMLRFSTGSKAMAITVGVGTGTDGVLVKDGGTLECKANTYYTLTFWRCLSYWLAELKEYSAAGAGTDDSGRTLVKTNESTIGYGESYVASQPTIELAADKFHIVGRCTGLTLTLPDGADMDGQEYCCQFYVGPPSFTLTLPASVYWQNGEAPEFASNTCCQLVIVNNCATIGVFKAS